MIRETLVPNSWTRVDSRPTCELPAELPELRQLAESSMDCTELTRSRSAKQHSCHLGQRWRLVNQRTTQDASCMFSKQFQERFYFQSLQGLIRCSNMLNMKTVYKTMICSNWWILRSFLRLRLQSVSLTPPGGARRAGVGKS